MGDRVIHLVVGGVSKSIAITSELIAGRKGQESAKARKGSLVNHTVQDNQQIVDDQNFTQQEWAADKFVFELSAGPECVAEPEDPIPVSSEQLGDDFLASHQFSREFVTTIQPLSQAVMIPQRRPGDKRRGFMSAYAPLLAETKGIDQDTFLDFISKFNLASKSSPIFDVVNLACFGLGLVPDSICIAVSTAVGTASAIAEEIQVRYRTNAFLEKANKALFLPRNCFAMIVTYKPDMPDDLVLEVDASSPVETALFKSLHDKTKTKKLLQRLQVSSATTTEAQMLEHVPLVHPGLDQALTSTRLTEQNKSALQKNSIVVSEYLDRRAQTEFATKNPSSKLAQSLPQQSTPYVNRFADPNHPVNSGSIFGLLSGGTFDPISNGRVRRAEHHAKKHGQPCLTEEEKHNAYMGRKVRGRVTGTPSKSLPIIGKMLKKDVLYLVIVEVPTAEQMKSIEGRLKRARKSSS